MFIEFGDIKFLWIGIFLVAGLVGVYFFRLSRKRYVSKELSTVGILKSVIKRRTVKENLISVMLLLALFSLFVALSNPMMRLSSEREGVNVVLVIDSSGSMRATDFKPNRIECAKRSAINFVKQLGPKDRVGVISFSDTTRIVSFLTNDKDRVIDKIKTITAGGGTAIGDGLALGVDMVTSIPSSKKLIILLSDGEQTTGHISIDDAIAYAKSKGVVVYTIGVGSNKKVILGYDWFGRPQYARLDEKSLRKIAEETGGEYFRATDTVSLEDIYKRLPKMIKKEKELQSVKDYFIWIAIVLILGSFIVKYWRRVVVW